MFPDPPVPIEAVKFPPPPPPDPPGCPSLAGPPGLGKAPPLPPPVDVVHPKEVGVPPAPLPPAPIVTAIGLDTETQLTILAPPAPPPPLLFAAAPPATTKTVGAIVD